MTDNAWLWFYVACMAAGALLFSIWSRRPTGVPQYEYTIAIIIPVWSGLAYVAMALGQGMITTADNTVYYARYIDWVVTTPLLLWALAATAMFYRRLDPALIAGLMFADVIMILSGLFADLSTDPNDKWVWYIIGCVCLALIVWNVWWPLRRIAYDQSRELGTAYTKAATMLTVLWIGYPTFWALGPSGIGVFDRSTDLMLFVLLPIVSKVGFSILDLSELRKLGARRPGYASDQDGHGLSDLPRR